MADECPVCFESLSDRPLITCNNGHHVCLACDMRIVMVSQSYKCPLCRENRTVDSLLDAYNTTNMKPNDDILRVLTFYSQIIPSGSDQIRLNYRFFRIIEETGVPPSYVTGLTEMFESLSMSEDTIHLSDRFGYLVHDNGPN